MIYLQITRIDVSLITHIIFAIHHLAPRHCLLLLPGPQPSANLLTVVTVNYFCGFSRYAICHSVSRILCYAGIQKQSLNSTLGKGTPLPQLWREDIHHHCTDWTREMTHNKLQSQVRGRGGGGAEGCLVSALCPAPH